VFVADKFDLPSQVELHNPSARYPNSTYPKATRKRSPTLII
jgi:hypothetical protein